MAESIEKDAEDVVSLIKEEVNQNFESRRDVLATKEDLHSLELKLTDKISQLETTVARTESRLILWAFIFWATQLGAIFALLKFLLP